MVMNSSRTVFGTGTSVCRSVAFLALAVVLAGCSPALQLKQVWVEGSYQGGPPKKVLVVCDMHVPTVTRAFESEFVKHLKARGGEAVESFRIVPAGEGSEQTGREAKVAQIRELGFDAVLVTRATKGRTEVRDIPGMTIVTGYGYYGGGVGVAATIGGPPRPTTQGYTHEQGYLTIDTQLFDVRTENRIWASQSELKVSGSPQEHVKPYVARITDEMAKTGLFKK